MAESKDLISEGREYVRNLSGIKAMDCFLAAIEAGEDAYNDIGELYFYAVYPYAEDNDKAREYFEKSPDNPNALDNLGKMYINGYGVAKDAEKADGYFRKAAKLYQAAADSGDANALYRLGTYYEYGLGGIEKDMDTATRYYSDACLKDNEDALCKIGDRFFDGIMYEKDYSKAAVFYEQAVNKPKAAERLGDIYRQGLGGEEDLEKASELYFLAGCENKMDEVDRIIRVLDAIDDGIDMDKMLCPCCGEPMTEENDGQQPSFVCEECGVVFSDKHCKDEQFRILFNSCVLSLDYGDIESAEQYAKSMREIFPDSTAGRFCSILAKYGVRYIAGRTLLRIERMGIDSPFYYSESEKLLRSMAKGREKESLYALVLDINAKLERYRKQFFEYRPLEEGGIVLNYDPEDEQAKEYADKIRDACLKEHLICYDYESSQDYPVDVYPEVRRFIACEYAYMMVTIASDRCYGFRLKKNCRRFSRQSFCRETRLTYIAVGGASVFGSLPETASLFIEGMDEERVLEDILGPVREMHKKPDHLLPPKLNEKGVEILERINTFRESVGLKPVPVCSDNWDQSSVIVAKHNYQVTNTYDIVAATVIPMRPKGKFRVETHLKNYHRNKIDFHCTVYDISGNRIGSVNQTITLQKEHDLCFCYFQFYNPDNGQPFFKPGYYYAMVSVNDREPLTTGFYVSLPERAAAIKRFAEEMDIDISETGGNLSIEGRAALKMEEAESEFTSRSETARLYSKIDHDRETIKADIFGLTCRDVEHVAVLRADGTVRCVGSPYCPKQKLATDGWKDIKDIVCVSSGVIGLDKSGKLLYAGTDKALANQLTLIARKMEKEGSEACNLHRNNDTVYIGSYFLLYSITDGSFNSHSGLYGTGADFFYDAHNSLCFNPSVDFTHIGHENRWLDERTGILVHDLTEISNTAVHAYSGEKTTFINIHGEVYQYGSNTKLERIYERNVYRTLLFGPGVTAALRFDGGFDIYGDDPYNIKDLLL